MTDDQTLDPDTFDLGSWLEGVELLHATVTLYGRRDLMEEIDRIVDELEPLHDQVAKLTDPETRPDESLADVGSKAREARERHDELRARLRELWDQYEASGVDFELVQLPSHEYDEAVVEVERLHPKPPFDASDAEMLRVGELRNAAAAEQIVLRSVKAAGPHGKKRTPTTLTPELLNTMQKKFGVDQFGELVGQARSLTLEGQVDAPFSRRVSAVLDEKTSG